jgi:DNA topoisomerase-2
MTSISKYKTRLEELEEKGSIKSIDNQSTENDPYFSFLSDKDFTPTLENMGLVDTTLMANMVLFDSEGRLKRYQDTNAILEEWCEARFKQYNIRKAGQLTKIEADSKLLYNKVRFIEMILEDKLVLKGKDEEQLTKELKTLKFDELPDYDYLLNIQVRQMTAKVVADLKNKYAASVKLHKDLKATPIKDIWIAELDQLLVIYDKWVKEQSKQN